MKKVTVLYVILFPFLFITGCDEDEEPDNQFNGTIRSIEDFLTPELTDIMTELGMEFNTGNQPPNIGGEYLAIPILEATNLPQDKIGSSFSDIIFRFEEQNNKELSVKFSYKQANESGEGIGALIAGKDNRFSALLKVSGRLNDSPAETAIVISGRLVPQGIEDFQWAIFMLESYGSPNLIENGQGRIFVDSDNLVSKTTANGRLKLNVFEGLKSMMEK